MSTIGVGLGSRRRARRFPIIPFLSWVLLIMALGLFFFHLIRFSQQNSLFSGDVTIAGVDVGGLTASEAITRVEQIYAQPVTLWYADSPIQLDPASLNWRTNRETMLADAQATGEQEAAFGHDSSIICWGDSAHRLSMCRFRHSTKKRRCNLSSMMWHAATIVLPEPPAMILPR
ncbi:MAG: hypothetical protein U0670_00725 [Anaerolineae bacterium]